MSIQTIKTRQEVSSCDTWKLEDIFTSNEAVLSSMEEAKILMNKLSSYKGQLTSSATTLFNFLTESDTALQLTSKIYVYCNMRLHEDGTSAVYQDLSSQSNSLLVKLQSAVSFANPEMSTLTDEQLNAMMKEEPKLELYKRYLNEILRQKSHILDANTEELLSQFTEIADAPSKIFAMFNNADVTFPSITDEAGNKVQLTQGNYLSFVQSKDVRVRKEAFEALNSSYAAFKNTLATTFSANVKQLSLFSKLKNYDSALDAKLSINNIPTDVYTTIIDTVSNNLPIMHDYIGLRKELLGVDELHMYDLYVPLIPDFNQPISFDEACALVLKSVEPLGAEYVAIMKEAFENRWIDKYENVGKRTGAYSWGTYSAPHPYVLMNYADNLKNLFTLAHELYKFFKTTNIINTNQLNPNFTML